MTWATLAAVSASVPSMSFLRTRRKIGPSVIPAAASHACTFCRQNFAVGAELFGGLGDRYSFGLKQTSHYAGPVIALNAPNGFTYRFSPQFGLNDNAAGVLWRFGLSYEIPQFLDLFRRSK